MTFMYYMCHTFISKNQTTKKHDLQNIYQCFQQGLQGLREKREGHLPLLPNDLNKSKMGALLTNMANWRRCRQKVKTKRENKELPIRLDLGWGEDCALVRN